MQIISWDFLISIIMCVIFFLLITMMPETYFAGVGVVIAVTAYGIYLLKNHKSKGNTALGVSMLSLFVTVLVIAFYYFQNKGM